MLEWNSTLPYIFITIIHLQWLTTIFVIEILFSYLLIVGYELQIKMWVSLSEFKI